jgi:hypothetical protein
LASLRRSLSAALLALAAFAAGPAMAQTFTATIGTLPDLGIVVPAETGPTTFRFNSAGTVSTVSGAGLRRTVGTVQIGVTTNCTSSQGNNACNSGVAKFQVGSTGGLTGKAGVLTNFTVGGVTGGTLSAVSGTNPLTFTITQTSKNTQLAFFIGADFPVNGNDSGGAYGTGNSPFYVWVATSPAAPSTGPGGNASVTTYRGLSLTGSPTLQFGGIVKPTSGSSTVTLNPAADYDRNVSGNAIGVPTPTAQRATYTVTGETGMTLTVAIPPTLTMNRAGGGSILVNLTSDSVPTNLGAVVGSGGTDDFYVGGNFTIDTSTLTGVYSGSYNVTVSYN